MKAIRPLTGLVCTYSNWFVSGCDHRTNHWGQLGSTCFQQTGKGNLVWGIKLWLREVQSGISRQNTSHLLPHDFSRRLLFLIALFSVLPLSHLFVFLRVFVYTFNDLRHSTFMVFYYQWYYWIKWYVSCTWQGRELLRTPRSLAQMKSTNWNYVQFQTSQRQEFPFIRERFKGKWHTFCKICQAHFSIS